MSKSFADTIQPENCLLIVDGLNLAFRWKHSGAKNFYEEYLKTVNSFKKSYKAKYVIIAADKGSSWYRKAIYPDYKGDRKIKAEEQTPQEKEDFEQFFADYNYTLEYIAENTAYPVLQFDKTEADDIAAYIVSKELPIDDIWLLSSDADWDLILREGVGRFSYLTRKETTLDNWSSNHAYSIDDLLSIKCLVGKKNNTLGVEGVADKRAIELVQKYGSVLDIVDALPIQSHLKHIQNLNNSRDTLLLNLRLMDLMSFCSDALGENTEKIDKILEEYIV